MILSDRDVRFMKSKEKIVKNTRRFAVILMSAFLAAALFINLTLSYLVVNKNRDNVFALGNVSLLLSEDNFPQDDFCFQRIIFHRTRMTEYLHRKESFKKTPS